MITKLGTLALLAVAFLAGCASTTQPSSLTGNSRPVYNDKGVIVGYQAK